MSRAILVGAGAVLGCCLLGPPRVVLALDAGPPRAPTSQSDRSSLGTTNPGVPTAAPPAPGLGNATVDAPTATPTPASGLRFFAKGYRFTGNTVFTQEALAALAAPYANREISNEDLAALRQALTRHYVEHGHLNSGALIPDQQIAEGLVDVTIVEGRLSEVIVTGNRRMRSAVLARRLQRAAGTPLNVIKLQDQFQVLLGGPFIARLNGELAPGAQPGEARLTAKVEEKSPFALTLGVNNDVTPSLGEVRGVARGAWYNPLGVGDIVNTDLGYADGSKEAQLGYLLPVNSLGTSLEIFGSWSKGEVVDERLSALDIEGETTTFGGRVNHLWRESAREQLGVAVGFDSRRSTTALLGRGFAFSPGVEPDGDSQVSVLRFVQHWTRRSPQQVFALRSTFSLGLDMLGATRNAAKQPDGRFVTWLGQAQWARRLPWRQSQVVFRLDGQWAADPLLPLEQFSVGGGRTVRGYARNVLVRDHGFATSLELRIPVWRDENGRTLLEFAPFVDAGGAWFKHREGPSPDVIPALGFGFRSDPHPRVHAEIYWGHALKDIPGAGDSLQEDGLYFALTADIFR